MTGKKMLHKVMDLGHGYSYIEVVKPVKATLHQLRQYIQHDKCGASLGAGEEHPYFGCWVCGAICPDTVVEKGMTILSMRIL